MNNVKVIAPPNGPVAKNAAQIKKMLEQGKTTSVYDNRYRPVNNQLSSASQTMQGIFQGAAGMLGNMTAFPAGPVHVGSTWSSTIDMSKLGGPAMPGMQMSGKMPVNFKVAGFKTVSGRKCIQLAVTATGTLTMNFGKGKQATSNIKTTSIMLFELSSGMMESVKGVTTTVTKANGQSYTSNQNVSIVRS
jgi:hypothetical protein